MSIVMLFSVLAGVNITAQAADEINIGQEYNVVFTGLPYAPEQTKSFTFTMPSGGYIYYKVVPKYYNMIDEEGGVYSYDNFYLPETKLTYNYKEYEKETSIMYGESWKSAPIALKKGAKITISLTDRIGENEESCYGLKVFFKKVKNFEKESNNNKKNATKMKLSTTYTGISLEDDNDWWVFTAPKTGKYKISAAEINDGFYHVVRVYKGSKLLSHKTIYSNDGFTTCFKGELKKGQKIYVLLDGGVQNEVYKIRVKSV